ncbi:MAG: NADH-quinone oxidoreductase subunit J [Bacilli bacterium]
MTGSTAIFFILALVAIMGGVLMLNVRRVSHMIVSLVFTFLAIAGIYVTLAAEFAAVVQILIYSGAITILMLFGIMLTKHDDTELVTAPKTQGVAAFIGVTALGGLLFFAVRNLSFDSAPSTLHVDNTEQVGIAMFSHHVIPFELTSVLLLVALVGAVILSKKEDGGGEDL